MATGNITNITGLQNDIDLSVVEAKVMKIIRSATIGAYASATATNPTQISAGTAIFRVPEMIQTGEYTYANRNDNPDVIEVGMKKINLDKRRVAKYEIETMDRAGVEPAGAIEGEIATGMGTAILSELDAEFLAEAAKQARNNFNDNDQGYVNDKYSTARTNDELNTMYFDTVDIVGDLEGTVGKDIVGTDKNEVIVITNTKATARFIKAGQSGSSGFEAFKNGILDIVNGIALLKHVFIGKEIFGGASFSKDYTYDFKIVEAIVLHTEALALPFNLNPNVITTMGENSGNPKFICKFQYGLGAIRNKLISGIFNVEPENTVFRKPYVPTVEGQAATDEKGKKIGTVEKEAGTTDGEVEVIKTSNKPNGPKGKGKGKK